MPRLGAMAEVGDRWVRTYDGPLTAAILREAMEWAVGAPRGRAELPARNRDVVAQRTLDAYRFVVDRTSEASSARRSRAASTG